MSSVYHTYTPNFVVTFNILGYQTKIEFERYSNSEYTIENLNNCADLKSSE